MVDSAISWIEPTDSAKWDAIDALEEAGINVEEDAFLELFNAWIYGPAILLSYLDKPFLTMYDSRFVPTTQAMVWTKTGIFPIHSKIG